LIKLPGGVICLIFALAFHEITTQIPHAVCMALPRGAEEPRLDHPPIKTFIRFATICRVTKIIRPYLEALL
jgi:hypothetical protein